MNCSERYDSLMQYAWGELNTDTASEMEFHLAGCERCRKKLEALKSMNACLRGSLSQSEDSPDMTSAVLSALPSKPKQRMVRWLVASGLTAAAVLLLIRLNLPAQHEPTRQVKLPEKQVIRSETKNIPPAPKLGVREQDIARKPKTTWAAVRPLTTKRPSAIRLPKPTAAAVNPVTHDQEKQPLIPDTAANKDAVVTVRIDPPQVVTDQDGTRSSATIKMEICGVEVTHTSEVVTLPPPPNPDAESIQRPELKTVSAGLFGRLSS